MMENVVAQKCVCISFPARVSSLQSLSCVAPDECLLFETTDCLEKYISLNVDHRASRLSRRWLTSCGHFDGKNTVPQCQHLDDESCRWTERYGNLPTIEHSLERLGDGTLRCEPGHAKLAVGTELMNNYREFVMPTFISTSQTRMASGT